VSDYIGSMPRIKMLLFCLLLLCFQLLQVSGQQVDTSFVESNMDTVRHAIISSQSGAMTLGDSIVQYAMSFKGKSYKRGGTTIKGFDCSGYTMTVYRKFGVKLPHTSAGQGLVGIDISKKNARKGDLIFFRGRNASSTRIGHVGIIVSEKDDPILFIHSSTSDGVRVDRLESPYYKKRYVKVVRVLN